jgi:ABC-2 type transport system ATP-binding protein
MLEMTKVRFGYGRRRAPLFESLDFSVRPGGIVGLLGKNGAGKTTLLKLGAGLLFPHDGQAELFGAEAALRAPEVLARISYVPEQFDVPSIRLRQFVSTHAAYYPRFDGEQMERYLRQFDVEGNDKLNELSYGQQKKVLISFALATGAELVILDEPTNGLDIPSKQVFRRLAAEAAGDERAFIISTHQVRDVENLIDPIVVLDNGRVVFEAALGAIQSGVAMRRFASEAEAERAGALAISTHLGSSIALVPAAAAEGEPLGSEIDLELLFQAAVGRPAELGNACGGAA